ncbi:MAG: hypothetical protein JWO53_1197 [Chlamydiia bacterium]|nr:hypothetical protein [Chlamydiia bacterium]
MVAKRVDTKEFELPETVFVRDIDNRLFQEIVLQCLATIPGILPVEGNFLDSILGRSEGIKGIQAEQDPKNHTISIKVEVNIAYGLSIPEKADEIQTRVTEEITKITGLHVALVHVVFKSLTTTESLKRAASLKEGESAPLQLTAPQEAEYSDVF